MKHFHLRIVMVAAIFGITGTNLHAATFSENRFIYPQYSKTISMDFTDAQLNDVLKIFSQQSGMNFIAEDSIKDKRINLYLDKVPVEEALEQILKANDLVYEIQPGSNIFVVKSSLVEDLLTRVFYLRHATVLSSKLNTTMKIETVTDEDSSSSSGLTSPSSQNPEKSNTGIAAAVKMALSKKGSLVEDPRTNSLIITDITLQFPIIEQTIARLDVPIPQVLIETEMLDISKESAAQLGFKIGNTPLTFKGAERDHYYPWDQNKLINSGLVSDPGYRVGTISAAGLTVALQFLRTQLDTKNLARPRILTLNNETAEIKIATNEAIGVAASTQAVQGVATQTSQAERVETGVFLTVTPQANILTQEITMAIVPKVIQARIGATFDGKTFRDPEERGSKSILRVQSGETIILAGLLRTDYTNTITKMPVLGDIPIVGAAFRHKDKKDTERELVIFITPHIVTEKSSQLALTSSPDIVREQSIPSQRRDAINKTLTSIEKKQR